MTLRGHATPRKVWKISHIAVFESSRETVKIGITARERDILFNYIESMTGSDTPPLTLGQYLEIKDRIPLKIVETIGDWVDHLSVYKGIRTGLGDYADSRIRETLSQIPLIEDSGVIA